MLLSGALLQLSARRTGTPGACGKGSRIFCLPRTACREKASATYRTSGRSLDLKIKAGLTVCRDRPTPPSLSPEETTCTRHPPKKRHADVLAFHAADSDPKRPVFRQTKQRRRPAGSAAPQRLPRHDPEYPTAHGYPGYLRFSLIYAPASLYKTDYIPHHGKRTVRTAETEPRYIHPTLSVICRTPDKIQNQTYGKSSGVLCGRRCLSIFRLQKTGLSLHPVRPAYGQATSRAHRRRSAGRRSWRPTRR